jgi:hypothetical protein
LDTRTKIVPFENLLDQLQNDVREQSWILVPGLFDPMTTVQARRLAQYAERKKLAVAVLDQPGTLLDARSRSELVAALRTVSIVSIADVDAWRNAAFNCETVAYEEVADRRWTRDFVQLVARRRP